MIGRAIISKEGIFNGNRFFLNFSCLSCGKMKNIFFQMEQIFFPTGKIFFKVKLFKGTMKFQIRAIYRG